jgi:hypothetical protein
MEMKMKITEMVMETMKMMMMMIHMDIMLILHQLIKEHEVQDSVVIDEVNIMIKVE